MKHRNGDWSVLVVSREGQKPLVMNNTSFEKADFLSILETVFSPQYMPMKNRAVNIILIIY